MKGMKIMGSELFFRCETCGNIVALIKVGGGELVCCGDPMIQLTPNSTDAAKEKHVPVTTITGDYLNATIGSVLHPMTSEHFIEWIAFAAENRLEIIFLKPDNKPKARFIFHPSIEDAKIVNFDDNEDEVPNCEGGSCNFSYNEVADNNVIIYAYCNLHGLWKADI